MAARATTKNTGGPDIITNPPRVTRILPHPKPGIFSTVMINPDMKKIQGNKASPKLTFPILLDFIIIL
jgi:hypothetical protein